MVHTDYSGIPIHFRFVEITKLALRKRRLTTYQRLDMEGSMAKQILVLLHLSVMSRDCNIYVCKISNDVNSKSGELMAKKFGEGGRFAKAKIRLNHEVDIESAHHDPSIYRGMLTDRVGHAQHPIISISCGSVLHLQNPCLSVCSEFLQITQISQLYRRERISRFSTRF